MTEAGAGAGAGAPKLLVATRSTGKQSEIRAILSGLPYEVVFPDSIGLYQQASEESIESGDSFEINARLKAEHFAKRSGLPTAADDSGLEVLSLGGLPGVRSRRFALPSDSMDQDAANNAELLRRLAGAPSERWSARYRCAWSSCVLLAPFPLHSTGRLQDISSRLPGGQAGLGTTPCSSPPSSE